MTATDAATAEPQQPATPAANEAPPAAEVDWKAKAREWERRAKENSKAAEQLAAIEEANKTEAQRAADAMRAAEDRAAKAESDALKYRVGIAAGLPADAIGRLQGSTEEELTADAATLAALLGKSTPTPATAPQPAPVSGTVPPAEQATADGNAWLRGQASRSR